PFTKFSASEGFVRSAGIGMILRFVARAISEAAASSGSLRRAQTAMSTPSPASARAMALPIPALPPVTSAVLPFNLRSIVAPFFGTQSYRGLAKAIVRRNQHSSIDAPETLNPKGVPLDLR